MSTSTSTAMSNPPPVVLTNSHHVAIIGLPPSDESSVAVQEGGKLTYAYEVTRPVTMRDLRLQVEQGFIPLVSIDRDTAGKALTGIRAGSAVAIVPNGDLNSIRAYYEGGIYTRPHDREPTTKEWCEYAGLAASRAAERYPTVAVSMISSWDYLTQIGHVDVRPGHKLAVHLYDAHDELADLKQHRTVWMGGWHVGYSGLEEGRPVVIETDGGFKGGVETSPRGGDGPTTYAEEVRSKFGEAKADANKLINEWLKDT